MLITTKERIVQPLSAIDALASVLLHALNKDVLNTTIGHVSPTTVQELLGKIRDITRTVATGDEHYFADLDIGYTEDTFPVTSY